MRTYNGKNNTVEKEHWVKYLEGKIAHNQDLIEIFKKRLVREQAEQERLGLQSGINCEKSIKEIEANIKSLQNEISDWEKEIKTNNFKGHY